MEARSTQVMCSGHRLRVTSWSGAGTRPLLALHGFSGAGSDFDPLARRLASPCFAPDLLGHGGSDAPCAEEPYAFEAQAALVGALVEGLGLERPVLVGYSFGGRLALRALHDDPSRYAGAVLVGATAGIEEPEARTARVTADAALAADLEARGVASFLEDWVDQPILRTQRRIAAIDRARMAAARGEHTARGLADSLRGAGTGSMSPLWGRLGHVDLPVLLLTGAEDPKFEALAVKLCAELRQAERWAVPGAGHCAHLERPEQSAARVQEFLDSVG